MNIEVNDLFQVIGQLYVETLAQKAVIQQLQAGASAPVLHGETNEAVVSGTALTGKGEAGGQ